MSKGNEVMSREEVEYIIRILRSLDMSFGCLAIMISGVALLVMVVLFTVR